MIGQGSLRREKENYEGQTHFRIYDLSYIFPALYVRYYHQPKRKSFIGSQIRDITGVFEGNVVFFDSWIAIDNKLFDRNRSKDHKKPGK